MLLGELAFVAIVFAQLAAVVAVHGGEEAPPVKGRRHTASRPSHKADL